MKIRKNIVTLLAVLVVLGSLLAIAAVPATAQGAQITVGPPQGKVGTAIAIGATLFSGSSALSATFDGVPIATTPTAVTTNTSGAANFTITAPARGAGTYTIVVTDGANVAQGAFTIVPAVTITAPTSKQGPVGTPITVSGTGFTANISAFAMFEVGGTVGNVTLGGMVTDAYGNFQVTGVVPAAASGNHTVWGYDLASPLNLTTYGTVNSAVFKITPGIAVNPNSGLVGSSTAISGSGWAPGNVGLFFGGLPWGNLTADALGVVTGTLLVPNNATAGVNEILATDGTNIARTTFTLVPAGLSVNPNSGAKCTSVLITGNTFTADPTGNNIIGIGNLTIGGILWNTAVIKIDTTGTMQPTTLLVPGNITTGAQQVLAKDALGRSAIATFTVTKPSISINPTTGAKSTIVVITGSGWVTGKQVTITYTYNNLSGMAATTTQSTMPDSSGNIAASMQVPSDAAAGSSKFQAADNCSGQNISDAVTFTIPGAIITLSPNSGLATTSVVLAGQGFLPFFPITVKIGSGATPYTLPVQAITDATGAFSVTFQMPGLAPGVQVITVTEGTNTATSFFTITPTPPTVGTQLAGISSQLVRVWGYTGGTWYLYDPADLAGSNLTTLTSGNGYWINVNAGCTLIYGAYSYTLTSGWNLIGWR